MKIEKEAPRIGVNTQPAVLQGSPRNLAALLETYASAGATHAEISPHGLDVIFNLRLRDRQVKDVRTVCEDFDMTYSVHAPNCLNYMDVDHIDLHEKMGEALLQFCAEIGARVLVVHAGRTERPLPREELGARLTLERDHIRRLADRGEKLSVRIAIENLNPERAFIEGRLFSYGLEPKALAEQIAAIDHRNVGATLDFGHAICASNWSNFDLLSAVRQIAPFTTHFHLTDAFGRPPTMPDLGWEYQAMYGMNDVDVPLGEGEVPFEAIFSEIAFPRFFAENGVLVIETKPRFIPTIGQFVETAKNYAETLCKRRRG